MKLIRMFLVLTLVIINTIWIFRWEEERVIQDAHLYSIDRFTNQLWMKYFPDSAVGYHEFPVLGNNISTLNNNQSVLQYIEKHAVSGYIVDSWRLRDRITYYFISMNLVLLVPLLIFTFSRKDNTRASRVYERS